MLTDDLYMRVRLELVRAVSSARDREELARYLMDYQEAQYNRGLIDGMEKALKLLRYYSRDDLKVSKYKAGEVIRLYTGVKGKCSKTKKN